MESRCMTTLTAEQFVERNIKGFAFASGHLETSQNALRHCIEAQPAKLTYTLYDAVVGLCQGQPLSNCLSPQSIFQLKENVTQAMDCYKLSHSAITAMNEFLGTCDRYYHFINSAQRLNATTLPKTLKQLGAKRVQQGRHTLKAENGELFEQLTWLTQNELTRIQSQIDPFHRLKLKCIAERTVIRLGQRIKEFKYQVEKGQSGTLSFARLVSRDKYILCQKRAG